MGKVRPLAIDLCCGKGGWTRGLLAAGWDVVGVDVESREGFPHEAARYLIDIRKLNINTKSFVRVSKHRKISLVVASPPCQEFSYRSFPFKRCRELAENVPPDKTIWRACERIARECEAPLILENVRGAQKYMEKAKAHYGSFYLWGDVPAILPIGKPTKGFEKRFCNTNASNYSSKSRERKEWSANAAIIPFELAYWIGKCYYSAWEEKYGQLFQVSTGHLSRSLS